MCDALPRIWDAGRAYFHDHPDITGAHLPMRRDDRSGRRCLWILEVHLVESGGRYGGFHEELLDI